MLEEINKFKSYSESITKRKVVIKKIREREPTDWLQTGWEQCLGEGRGVKPLV